MEENIILTRQNQAEVVRIFLISAVTMLPVLSYGMDDAYLTVALPKYLENNPTGIVLDLDQLSWIGKLEFSFSFYFHLLLP